MASNSRFPGKIALVPGARRGIGTVDALREHGRKVIVLGIVNTTLQDHQKIYNEITTVQVNLGNWKATKEAIKNLPTVDLLFNIAGVLKLGSILDTNTEDISLLLNVNLDRYLNVAQVVARKLIADERTGHFINVASVCANKPIAGVGAYCVSKLGVQMMNEVLACKLGPQGIRLKGINAGDLLKMYAEEGTRITAEHLSRIGEVSDVVNEILYLVSD